MPTRIPGCVLWLRADLGITLNGGNVSAWADQSGGSHNFTQGTGTKQPTYSASDAGYAGRPVLTFSGGQVLSALDPVGAQPFTIAIVGESSGGAGQGDVYNDSNGPEIVYLPPDTAFAAYAGSTIVGSNRAQGHASIVLAVFNGAASAIYTDTRTSPVSGNAGTGGAGGTAFVGGGGNVNFLTGKIAEVIAYSRALNASEIASLVSYAGALYQVPVS